MRFQTLVESITVDSNFLLRVSRLVEDFSLSCLTLLYPYISLSGKWKISDFLEKVAADKGGTFG
jgi:hypothetical protein